MTIIRRGDRYGVKVWETATRRYRWVGTFATEPEALEAQRFATLDPARDRLTVADWAKVWLADYPRSAPATRRTYRYAAEQIVSVLGSRRLDEITRPQARRQALSWPRNVSRVARTMWADAVRDGITAGNPWTGLRLETPRGRRDLDALTEQQILGLAALATTTRADDYAPELSAIILTLGFVGLRPGELCALRCADVNLPDRELVVRATVDATGVEKPPKNGKPRVVTIPPAAAAALSQHPASIDGVLFHTPRGRRLTKGTLHYLWRPVQAAWRAQEGRHLELYELRHSAATNFLERGATPADVAVQLGHTDGGRLVMTLYGHPAENLARDRLKMAYASRHESSPIRRAGAS